MGGFDTKPGGSSLAQDTLARRSTDSFGPGKHTLTERAGTPPVQRKADAAGAGGTSLDGRAPEVAGAEGSGTGSPTPHRHPIESLFGRHARLDQVAASGASVQRQAGAGVQRVEDELTADAFDLDVSELEPAPDAVHDAAREGTSGEAGALPHLEQIQASFGRHDVRTIKSHQDDRAAIAANAIGASAYATGDHAAFAEAPSLHTAAHEAAHVVQQRAGVPLVQGIGRAGDRHEQHADAVADRVVRGQPAEPLLTDLVGAPRHASSVAQAGHPQAPQLQRRGGKKKKKASSAKPEQWGELKFPGTSIRITSYNQLLWYQQVNVVYLELLLQKDKDDGALRMLREFGINNLNNLENMKSWPRNAQVKMVNNQLNLTYAELNHRRSRKDEPDHHRTSEGLRKLAAIIRNLVKPHAHVAFNNGNEDVAEVIGTLWRCAEDLETSASDPSAFGRLAAKRHSELVALATRISGDVTWDVKAVKAVKGFYDEIAALAASTKLVNLPIEKFEQFDKWVNVYKFATTLASSSEHAPVLAQTKQFVETQVTRLDAAASLLKLTYAPAITIYSFAILQPAIDACFRELEKISGMVTHVALDVAMFLKDPPKDAVLDHLYGRAPLFKFMANVMVVGSWSEARLLPVSSNARKALEEKMGLLSRTTGMHKKMMRPGLLWGEDRKWISEDTLIEWAFDSREILWATLYPFPPPTARVVKAWTDAGWGARR